ncbi:PAS domain S-box protein [Pontibacter sp. KCTC 32443]|uniref:ATP-binding protein n=1 Tax=Pontibacter TaxID=323449 RepID=UPI00164E5B5D|nr:MULTISPECIES: ATP-binding protein [Pontibacter]MBC5774631.1 PAS domain S-box protein [Pontibacter sp. KCTC 32443]
MSTTETENLENIFCGNSQMAYALRNYDWDNSSLGPVTDWPESLRNTIRLMLTSAYPMFVWWGEEMIMFYNDAYIPVLGSKHPAAVGKSGKKQWKEIWHVIGPLMENVLRNGETCYRQKDLLYTKRNRIKEETYYTYSYSPIFNTDGSIGGLFCACHEDTLQVLSERRLTTISRISGVRTDITVNDARLEVMQVLAENRRDLPFVLLYKAEEGKFILDNYTKEAFTTDLQDIPELLQPPISLHNPEDDGALVVTTIPAVLRNLLKKPEHGVLPDQVAVVPVKDAGHNIIRGYFIVGISAVLPLNDDYLNFFKLLSSQVNATVTNVRAFEQERLLSKKLLELDKAKTDFFSNVSHELRTPLTLIMGPLELLLNKPNAFSEEDKESLRIMQRNGLRLLKQVNNLLSFSFVEAGRYKASFVPTALASFTGDLASTFESVMMQSGLKYRVSCNAISEPVYVDTDMWEMIVLNLLSNAYKFTLSGSIGIELVEEENDVVLLVSDTGVGIPEKDLPHLFERFYRVEQNIGRTFDGSGIGLALVAELVKLHGGSINVTSTTGKGSTFIVTIPKGRSHLPQDKIGTETEADRSILGPQKPDALSLVDSDLNHVNLSEDMVEIVGLNEDETLPIVLLVDDNLDMIQYVSRLLKKDYRVLTALNGQQALEVLRHQKPDLILSDVMMPVMDGVTLLNKVRKIPELVAVPVILLSARAGEEDKVLGFNTGADDYLVKPFSASELVTRIRSTIRNAKQRNEWKVKEQKLLSDTAERKELLESILNSISDAFYHVNNNLEFVYVNNRALEITNKTREEHIGRNVLDVYPYLAGSELYKTIQVALQTLQPVSVEYFDIELSRWFDCRLYPTAKGSTGYFADITDRKLEEIARIESENRFREVANAAPVLIWMSGTDKLCNFFNNRWLEFRGRTSEEEYGNGWTEGVHPDDLENCIQTYTNAFEAGRQFSIEYRLLNKDGEYRWILDNGCPRFTPDGQLLGYIGACTDITELKWAETLLSKYNSELEARVASRTAELQKANDQLKIEIKEKIRKKQELIKSHEQLHSLTSHLQDLREKERKLIAREIHDDLGQALTALKIEILLLYDRIEDSRSKYKNVMLESLGSMEKALDESLISLRKIISHLRPSLSDDLELVYEIQKLVTDLEKRIGIPIAVRSRVKKIELEPNIAIEVYRVMQESVTNIIKHACATAASIEITKENDKFRFLVTDNGIGFDDSVLAEKRSFGILGIKERAQRIGADLIIESCPGKGTTVELLVDATLKK